MLLGEIERTMLVTFCAAANIKAFMQQQGCPDALKQLLPLVEALLKEDTRGTLMSELLPLEVDEAKAIEDKSDTHLEYRELERKYYDAMVSQQTAIKADLPYWTPGKRAATHDSYTFRGLSYSRHLEGRAGGMIFFRPHGSDTFVPGVIRKIFTVAAMNDSHPRLVNCALLAVHRFQPCPDSMFDPFRSFPAFGAGIWSRATSPTIEIVPGAREFHHAIAQRWNETTHVLKSTATVSQRACHLAEILTPPHRRLIEQH